MKFKKIVKIVLLAVVSLGIVQCVRFAVENMMLHSIPIEKEEGNCMQYVNECNVGNRVAVRKSNGLSTFPFVFGERLYLYDIDKDKKALLAYTFLPFTEIGDHTVLTTDAVIYNKPYWDTVFGDYYLLANNKKKELDVYDLYYGYSVSNNCIYYEKIDTGSQEYEEYGPDLCSDIYVMNLENDNEKKFLEGNIGYFRIIEGKMYCYDLKKEKILIVDLESGNTEEFPYHCVCVEYIIRSEQDKMYILDCVAEGDDFIDRIVEYNMETSEIVWEQQVVPKSFNEKIHLNDGELYFLTEDNCICKVSASEKEQVVVIDLNKEVDGLEKADLQGNENISVSYCEDYIAVDIYYYFDEDIKENQELLIFDYEGNFIRKI